MEMGVYKHVRIQRSVSLFLSSNHRPEGVSSVLSDGWHSPYSPVHIAATINNKQTILS
jgi:hypothetical protein